MKNLVFMPYQVLIEGAERVFFTFMSKLDFILRTITGLMGAGSFDLSLLNCVSITFEFPDIVQTIIENLLCFIASLLNGLIIPLATDWIADLINNILCFPITILNTLIGKLNKFLPKCVAFNADICAEVLAGLQELSTLGDMISGNFSALGSDLGAMSLSIANLGDKVRGFGEAANCAQPANNFINSMTL